MEKKKAIEQPGRLIHLIHQPYPERFDHLSPLSPKSGVPRAISLTAYTLWKLRLIVRAHVPTRAAAAVRL
jgi:hypothetical protein